MLRRVYRLRLVVIRHTEGAKTRTKFVGCWFDTLFQFIARTSCCDEDEGCANHEVEDDEDVNRVAVHVDVSHVDVDGGDVNHVDVEGGGVNRVDVEGGGVNRVDVDGGDVNREDVDGGDVNRVEVGVGGGEGVNRLGGNRLVASQLVASREGAAAEGDAEEEGENLEGAEGVDVGASHLEESHVGGAESVEISLVDDVRANLLCEGDLDHESHDHEEVHEDHAAENQAVDHHHDHDHAHVNLDAAVDDAHESQEGGVVVQVVLLLLLLRGVSVLLGAKSHGVDYEAWVGLDTNPLEAVNQGDLHHRYHDGHESLLGVCAERFDRIAELHVDETAEGSSSTEEALPALSNTRPPTPNNPQDLYRSSDKNKPKDHHSPSFSACSSDSSSPSPPSLVSA
ncbi:hypothetical protein K435DRAFT_875273 [Dendrothele bispora CBS 962.96]|uniref:Uncharacterized protein n=1 Tax=Dendrothele bispora (strain CBS 962.96) TaxID=1314807 RepID=A0A4V4HBK0_DENBC|nr:hypothetical protein K435DRAFT_875273 [Dendrothele bispora CBS 962.96]